MEILELKRVRPIQTIKVAVVEDLLAVQTVENLESTSRYVLRVSGALNSV
jgi:hypothetical protein